MQIGFIGLGIMGSRMAKNLHKSFPDLKVYNRTKTIYPELEEIGISTSQDLNSMIQECDVIITMLSKPSAIQDLIIDSGVIDDIKQGSIWIDCSTVDPAFSLSLNALCAERSIQYLDAPVAGTKPHAANGELVFFVGNNGALKEKLDPLFEAMGKKVVAFAKPSFGVRFKMIVNVLLAESMLAFAESVKLGQQLGLDKNFLLDTLPNLVVAAPFTKMKAPLIAQDNYDEQFPLELMHKDLKLALTALNGNDTAYNILSATEAVYAKANTPERARLDFSAVFQYLQDLVH